MTNFKKQWINVTIISIMMNFIFNLNAYAHTVQPKFTIVPKHSSTVFVGLTATAEVTYVVTNKLPVQQVLSMTPINGVTQTTSGTQVCQNPMRLNSGESCFLKLSVSGYKFAADKTTTIANSPQICIGTSQLSCSQPSKVDWLKVKVITSYVTIGGTTITGVTSSGLTLQNTGTGEIFEVPASPSTPLVYFTVYTDSSYDIVILTEPSNVTCYISNPIGIATTNVSNVNILCAPIPVTIGGTVTGLTASGLTLKNGGKSYNVPVNPMNPQTYFSVPINSPYDVIIFTQPTGLYCTVSNQSGIASTDISNVDVACVPTYTVMASFTSFEQGTITPSSPQIVPSNGSITFTASCAQSLSTLSWDTDNTTCAGNFTGVGFNAGPITFNCAVAFLCTPRP